MSRRTGKTQRMLEAAFEMAQGGTDVTVYSATLDQRTKLFNRFLGMYADRSTGWHQGEAVHLKSGGSVFFQRLTPTRLRGVDRPAFVDHYFFEEPKFMNDWWEADLQLLDELIEKSLT